MLSIRSSCLYPQTLFCARKQDERRKFFKDHFLGLQISVHLWMEGRKEGRKEGESCGLFIKGTIHCCFRHYALIHPDPSLDLFFPIPFVWF